MYSAVIALIAAVAAAPAPAHREEPPQRDCSTSAYGDLGRGWQRRAVVAGPLAFVGLRSGYGGVPPKRKGQGALLKVLIVVEPAAVATVTMTAKSRRFATLGYHDVRSTDGYAPLTAGTPRASFVACAKPNPRAAAWNRGTQFPGYFLVSGRRCVDVVVRVRGGPGPMLRTLRFGVARCG